MARVVIWGKDYEIPTRLTLGEAADVERICDGAEGEGKELRRMLAMTWIAVRRIDASATFENIRDLNFDEMEWVTDDPEAEGAASPDVSGNPAFSESTASDPGTLTGS